MVDFVRRQILRLALGATALPAVARPASALDYPSRPVRIVVSLPAGLAPDVDARLVAEPLSERLGQPVVIENRPGANSNIGTEFVVKALPDGYTLLLVLAGNAINTTLYPNLPFNFTRDIVPVASIGTTSWIMVVSSSVPAKTVPEFIAYAKANPRKINMASSGYGSSQHVYGELVKRMTGVDLVHVPYRGIPQLLTDLIGGQVQVSFEPLSNPIEHIRTGKLRALGVTAASRSVLLPDIPTVGEFVPGYEASGWQGIAAPKNTRAEIVTTLNQEINAGLADAEMKARFINQGGYIASAGSPADFAKLIADYTEKWGKVIRAANIRLD
jgi:tripartite-type tricarboxylate transporter receptor subunit TctC